MRLPSTLAVALTTGALGWTVLLFLAPLGLTDGSRGVAAGAALVYEAAGMICHQRPERSFHVAGVQQPVCARCVGLYVSGAFAALAALVGTRRNNVNPNIRATLAAAALPTAITVALEYLGVAHPSNMVRAVCALPLGAVAGWVFVTLLTEPQPSRTPRIPA